MKSGFLKIVRTKKFLGFRKDYIRVTASGYVNHSPAKFVFEVPCRLAKSYVIGREIDLEFKLVGE